MTFDTSATVRALNSKPYTPWLPITTTIDAADLKTARQQFLNHLILSGLEYGTLNIGWDLSPVASDPVHSSPS